MTPRQVIFTVVVVVMFALVFHRGGRWERLGAVALFLAAFITPFVQDKPRLVESPQYGVLAVDTALFLALTAIALKGDKWWPLWAAGLQPVGIFVHVARIIDPFVLPHAYYRGLSIHTYLVIAPLLVGAWTHKRE